MSYNNLTQVAIFDGFGTNEMVGAEQSNHIFIIKEETYR